ncbi:hypothetical protein [Pseudomonas sp. YuFO8]|uniref:hypothetical protein n=1 Tax=Pseudomonas sp. YuFO8 TaxID=3095361 RepID=UPI002B2427C6|nr:hypothetical protein [Pseudomonas sp. YuFO8]
MGIDSNQSLNIMKTNPWLPRPLVVAIIAGTTFFIITQSILIIQAIASGARLGFLNSTDTISLLAGTMTAAGLAAVYIQVYESDRNARSQSALHLDALHAHFNSTEMRMHRNLAFVYLRFLMESPERLQTYARYWILDISKDVTIPTPEDLVRLSGGANSHSVNAYDDLKNVTFMQYDSAVSAVVSFYARLSAHLRQNFPEIVESGTQLDEATLEAFGPFFWNYWQGKLIPLGNQCQEIYKTETSEAGFGPPFFVEHFNRLKTHLGSNPPYAAPSATPHSEPSE